MSNLRRTSSSASGTPNPFKFPAGYEPPTHTEDAIADSPFLHPQDSQNSSPQLQNGSNKEDYWQAKRKGRINWANETISYGMGRKRQKSLSEAIRTIKGRRASVSENAHEIAEALKAPISPKLVLLCSFWFMTSVFSNASSKSILIAFRFPVTLTLVQFAFVSSWCVASSLLARRFPSLRNLVPALRYDIQPPSKDLIITTLPLTAFQIGGHILNSDAMARIPVSLVHTIKGLSPLFTVLAYRVFSRVHYSIFTYLSLIPLTLGVIMACSANFKADGVGLLFAFGSTVLFVTQNIMSKKLFDEAARAESEGLTRFEGAKKPDKLNLLCYSSALAFTFTFPIWIWSEGFTIMKDILHRGSIELSNRPDALDHGRLSLEFIFNGTFHFAQSLVAFVLLSMVSTVTYSVASLIKRVFVIVFAIVWFGNPMTTVQGVGISLTFVGLYLYDRTNDANRADRRAKHLQARSRTPLLPLIAQHKKADIERSYPMADGTNHSLNANGYIMSAHSQKRDDDAGISRVRNIPFESWLPPGTKQESTWNSGDLPVPSSSTSG